MTPTLEEIEAFASSALAAHQMNRTEEGTPYFDAPIFGVADAADPLFASYKTVIGDFHQTPAEAYEKVTGKPLAQGSVISWSMPITETTRKENAKQKEFPCRRWTRTRHYGQLFIDQLTKELVTWLGERGVTAAIPKFSPRRDEKVGFASDWSERHAAYAAGLGTFSLNDAMITERGIAHRLSSVVVDTIYPPTGRDEARGLHGNCLYFAKGTCKACVKRCPTGALSEEGHDKDICKEYCYGKVMDAVGEEHGVTITGCGLCQTAVPCEAKNPVK